MKAAILFSGGKDSALTSLLLEPFFDQIELITFSFGNYDTWKVAALAAKQLGYTHRMMVFEETVLDRALEILISTGYPNDALNYVHSIAVETLAQDWKFVADGTRRDDRAPIMSYRAICSLEDRLKMHYLRPLAGLGGRTIEAMASRYIDFQEELSENYPASDFEVGLRHALIDRHGPREVERIFPKNHMHTRVIRRKRFVKEIKRKED
jgi:tRNA methyltransferase